MVILSFGKEFFSNQHRYDSTGTLIQNVRPRKIGTKSSRQDLVQQSSPNETNAPIAPNARPRSCMGKTSVMIPAFVAIVILSDPMALVPPVRTIKYLAND